MPALSIMLRTGYESGSHPGITRTETLSQEGRGSPSIVRDLSNNVPTETTATLATSPLIPVVLPTQETSSTSSLTPSTSSLS
jgi:hypothetical protein